jgi:hypothetical protein
MGARAGALHVLDCTFSGPASWDGGWRAKWWIRLHGHLRELQVRRTTFPDCQEWCVYGDALGYDGAVSPSVVIVGCKQLGNASRGFAQLVARASTHPSNAGGNPCAGTVIFSDLDLRSGGFDSDPSTPDSSGGAAITVAGSWGDVWIDQVRYVGELQALAVWADGAMRRMPDGTILDPGGAAVDPASAWPSEHEHGVMMRGDGFANGAVHLGAISSTIVAVPNESRPHAAVTTAAKVVVHGPLTFVGPREGLHLAYKWGVHQTAAGPLIPTGPLELQGTVTASAGWPAILRAGVVVPQVAPLP